MLGKMSEFINSALQEMREVGTYKTERVITSPQGAWVTLADGRRLLNLCANNYLGLSGHPEIADAAVEGIKRWGFGLSSVRFICGTQELNRRLEEKVSEFLGTEDTLLYSSCFDANGGLFETLLSAEDAIISDALNHASIIDGVRLCKAQRHVYQAGDMASLEAKLQQAAGARFRLIATDGVFSMDGSIANLPGICDLADRYQAMVMIDDSHATGVLGETGRGTHEHHAVWDRVDIITSTFGKALGGASGGFTSGRKPIIELLRQRSRPYLFSNTLAPAVAAGTLRALEMVSESTALRDALEANTLYFRRGLQGLGFQPPEGEHPIIPLLIGDTARAVEMAARLLEEGVYLIAFSYPVVPKGTDRLRVQMSAALARDDLDLALEKLEKVGRECGVL